MRSDTEFQGQPGALPASCQLLTRSARPADHLRQWIYGACQNRDDGKQSDETSVAPHGRLPGRCGSTASAADANGGRNAHSDEEALEDAPPLTPTAVGHHHSPT